MKTFRLFTVFIIAMICAGFASCSKDNDDNDNSASIIGTWYSEDEKMICVFEEEGIGCYYEDKYDYYDFTYKLNGNKLTMDFDEKKLSVTIQINGNTLKAIVDNETLIFKRIDPNDL